MEEKPQVQEKRTFCGVFRESGENNMARKPSRISLATIAAELGISQSAVSRAVNCRAGVGEETRRRVEALLRKYRFTPNYPARERRVAVVTRSAEISTYHAAAVSGICRYARESGMGTAILFCGTGNALAQVRDQQCSGVIVLVPAEFAAELPELAASGLPVMLVDEATGLPGVGYVDNDSRTGSRLAAEHLLRLGHRAIGFLASGSPTGNHLDRLAGWRDALAAAGIEPAGSWIAVPPPGGGSGMADGGRMIAELLDRAPGLTAVMAADDDIAFGAMRTLRERGVRIPEDLSITGFDDCPFAAYAAPPLTTVRHPVGEAGYRAARAIDRFLSSPGGEPPWREVLPTGLVERSSTGPVPER